MVSHHPQPARRDDDVEGSALARVARIQVRLGEGDPVDESWPARVAADDASRRAGRSTRLTKSCSGGHAEERTGEPSDRADEAARWCHLGAKESVPSKTIDVAAMR